MSMKKRRKNFLPAITILTFLVIRLNVCADVKTSSILGNNMVLQRNIPVPIWGWADPGEKVTVSFGVQEKSTVADVDGKWMIRLDPLKVCRTGRDMIVSGKNKLIFRNVLVGDVWVCSGQSNMECWTKNALNAEQELANANYPEIRLIDFPRTEKTIPMHDINSKGWTSCDERSVANFSAVGYYFGSTLFKALNIPIGLIGSNWGGTRIEPWTPRSGFMAVPELRSAYKRVEAWDSTTPAGRKAYSVLVEKVKDWIKHAESDLKSGKRIQPMPEMVGENTSNQMPTKLFNGMISPMIPYAIRGVIWYQGESNGNDTDYDKKMRALIIGWRTEWNQGDFPFYYVQLANFGKENTSPAGGGWANIREAQLRSLQIPNTGMAVTIDIGEANNIHPVNKQDVGKRLALWALVKEYHKQIVYSGPLFKSYRVEGNKIKISFEHTGDGLMAGLKEGLEPVKEVNPEQITCFAVQDKDGKWHKGNVRIEQDLVVVSSAGVEMPVAVRYAFSMNPGAPLLYNKEGLPASPFKTDL